MNDPDLPCLERNEQKLALLRAELGQYIRNIYRPIAGDSWKVSVHHPIVRNKIRFHRIVRASATSS